MNYFAASFIAIQFLVFFSILKISYFKKYKKLLLTVYFAALSFLLCYLIHKFINADLSLKLSANNTHALLPTIYRISALWGNNDGSLFLFFYIFVFCGFYIYKYFSPNNENIFLILVLAFGLTVSYFNPFEINNDLIKTHQGFNPLLQDFALSIHPPILYIGNALQLIILCLAFNKNNSKILFKINRISWTFLTIGIALGSWWAYRELGWGGIWFWDPVETISILPWISSTALLHIKIKKKSLSLFFYIFSLLGAFSFTLGTTLIRSGLITSIHSFALDPKKGIVLAAFLCLIILIGLNLLRKNIRNIKSRIDKKYIYLNWGMIVFSSAILTLVFSLFYPVLLEAFTQNKIEISENFYRNAAQIFSVLILSLILLQHLKIRLNAFFLLLSIIPSLLLTVCISYFCKVTTLGTLINTVIAFTVALQSLLIMNKRNLSMTLGHLSFCILVLSIGFHYQLSKSDTFTIKEGEKVQFNQYEITLKNTKKRKSKNYISRYHQIELKRKDQIVTLEPELRYYPIEQQYTIESDRHSFNLIDELYVVTGNSENNMVTVELKHQAFIRVIWMSVLLMVCSLSISIMQKRNV